MKLYIKGFFEYSFYLMVAIPVHDEIVSAVPKAYAVEFGDLLQAAMIRGMEKVCEKAPVAAEISIGRTWG